VLLPWNRAKPCKFRYVHIKLVRNFMWKLCYRKDRAMRPIRKCPENFQGSLITPTTTIPRIFHGLLFRSTLWMCLQNLKSVALPVPEIIGGIQNILAAPGYAHAPFSPKLFMGFYSDWPCKCRSYSPNLKSVALPVPEIIGGTQKIWTAAGYAHAPFSPKFLTGFYSEWPCKYILQIWSP